MRRTARRGFSLMEVLLATSILLACLVVLGELAEVGRRHAVDIQELTDRYSKKATLITTKAPLVNAVSEMPWKELILAKAVSM